jgi:hypothetical protein
VTFLIRFIISAPTRGMISAHVSCGSFATKAVEAAGRVASAVPPGADVNFGVSPHVERPTSPTETGNDHPLLWSNIAPWGDEAHRVVSMGGDWPRFGLVRPCVPGPRLDRSMNI